MPRSLTLRQRKFKLLEKVFETGLVTDKQICDISPEDMLKIKGITTTELKILCDLRDNLRQGTVMTFLALNE
jgi:hypothetical protein